MARIALHIARRVDWDAAIVAGDYRISAIGRTLAEVGFIHASTATQVRGVADRYYRGVPDLLLLTIDLDRVSSRVQFDPVGEETYPHIYGPLNLDAVVRVTPLVHEGDGRVVLPDSMGG